MARKLYLHAGKHKTGSTSIQHYLEAHEDFFQKMGFTLIQNSIFTAIRKRKEPKYNCYNLAHMLIRPELMTPIRIRDAYKPCAVSMHSQQVININNFLKDTSGDAIIISAEAFSFLRTAKERALYDLMFADFDVRPIIFLRESGAWLKSWEKQLSMPLSKKEKFNIISPKDSIFDISPGSWLADDNAICDFFQINDHTLSYDDAISKYGNVIPAFLKELGLIVSECPPWKNVWHNRTLK